MFVILGNVLYIPMPVTEAKMCPPGQFPWVTSFAPNEDNPTQSTLTMSCKNPVVKDNTSKAVREASEYYATRVKILQFFSTTIAFGLLIAAGYSYMMSGGNDKSIQEAKKLLILSAVGFFVTSAGFIIYKLIEQTVGIEVLTKVFG